MKYDFAALRFTDDANICDRVYWYLAEFPVKESEEVLAPVGPRDRLQKANVERTLTVTEENAPYDMRLIKRVEAKFGMRVVQIGNVLCREFGGVRYDSRHYTRFGAVLYADEKPAQNTSGRYEKLHVFELPELGDETIYRTISLGHGTILIGGEGREICKMLLSLVKDHEEAKNFLRNLGFAEGEIFALRNRLG